MSVMPGVTRGEAGGRKTRCLCVQRGFFFAPTHLAPPFDPAPESLCHRNLPVCRLGVDSLVGAARAFWTSWARWRRCGACPWRSCTSGVQCTAQLAVGTRRRPRAVRQKKAVRAGVTHGSGGTGEWVFCGALQLELVGARCAAPAALLQCESQFTPDAACADANERAARGSQRDTGAGVRAGAAVADRWQKVQQRRTFEARRVGGREGEEMGGLF